MISTEFASCSRDKILPISGCLTAYDASGVVTPTPHSKIVCGFILNWIDGIKCTKSGDAAEPRIGGIGRLTFRQEGIETKAEVRRQISATSLYAVWDLLDISSRSNRTKPTPTLSEIAIAMRPQKNHASRFPASIHDVVKRTDAASPRCKQTPDAEPFSNLPHFILANCQARLRYWARQLLPNLQSRNPQGRTEPQGTSSG